MIYSPQHSIISVNDKENYISNMGDFLMGIFEDEEKKY